MKKEYLSPEFEYIRISLAGNIMGDSNPEHIKEDGEIIDDGGWG